MFIPRPFCSLHVYQTTWPRVVATLASVYSKGEISDERFNIRSDVCFTTISGRNYAMTDLNLGSSTLPDEMPPTAHETKDWSAHRKIVERIARP